MDSQRAVVCHYQCRVHAQTGSVAKRGVGSASNGQQRAGRQVTRVDPNVTVPYQLALRLNGEPSSVSYSPERPSLCLSLSLSLSLSLFLSAERYLDLQRRDVVNGPGIDLRGSIGGDRWAKHEILGAEEVVAPQQHVGHTGADGWRSIKQLVGLQKTSLEVQK